MFAQPTRTHRKCLLPAAMVVMLMGLFLAPLAPAARASDILWYNNSTGESQIWVMDGHRVNHTATVLGETGKTSFVGPPFSIVAAGDFSGDYKDDIVWYNSSTGETQIWVMNAFQVSSRATVLGPDGKPTYIGPPFSIAGAGDFNGDGKDELLWYNSSTGAMVLWLMNGARVSSTAQVVGPDGKPTYIGPPFSIVGVGDFNGDGKDDIVWHNSSTGAIVLWLMNGARVSSTAQVLGPNGQPTYIGLPWSIVGAGDFNGDANDDIVWHNSSTNETQIWLMNGARVSSTATVLASDGTPTYVGLPFRIVGVKGFTRGRTIAPPTPPPPAPLPQTLHFHADVTTPDWAPIGGSFDIDVSANGDYTFSGHMHNSGFLNIQYALGTVVLAPTSGGYGAVGFAHSGSVDGTATLFGRRRDDDWTIHNNNPDIRAHWQEIARGSGLSWKLQAQDTLSGGLEGLLEDTAKDAVKSLAKAAVDYLIKAVVA